MPEPLAAFRSASVAERSTWSIVTWYPRSKACKISCPKDLAKTTCFSKSVMDNVLKYHIENTNKQFDEIKESLHEIHDRIDDVQKFKAEMLISSRIVSVIISAVCGFLTMIATTILSYYVQVKLK